MNRTSRLVVIIISCASFTLPAAATAAPAAKHAAEPLVIGHRGASGHRPEHTLAAYELAARMGADYIEPDLVSTKDHVLVARHENEISGTTDVAERPEFAARKTTKVIDGVTLTGWFTEDFTLAELRTLRAKERIPQLRQRNTIYDGRYRVPTFEGVIWLVKRLSRELGRPIGIYPETKHPSYFRAISLPLEAPLVDALHAGKLDKRKSRVFIQSFEVGNLQALDRRTDVPLVQLLGGKSQRPADDPRTYAQLATPAGLAAIARYADGVGPSKDYIVPRDGAGNSLAPTPFVDDAHAVGLLVHPYTFRNENGFLALELRRGSDPAAWGDAIAEYELFFGLGVDGVFSDYPDTAIEAREGPLD
ncbi:MAG: glycerophosphodiester phosphodiesterase [Actinomycetota bacterium]|nr:glycerophosphodiester phosphodiesterase [Actinomycetota bacterium]